MTRNLSPRFPVSLPRRDRAHLIADLKDRLPESSHVEIAGALRLAAALLTPHVNRGRLVRVAELLIVER
jgi:hypothetical protein